MIRRSLGEWWMFRYPIPAPPKTAGPADRPGPPAGSGESAPAAPFPAPAGDGAASRPPEATTDRPPLWWTGGALGSALRARRWSAWLAIGAGLVAVAVAAAAS